MPLKEKTRNQKANPPKPPHRKLWKDSPVNSGKSKERRKKKTSILCFGKLVFSFSLLLTSTATANLDYTLQLHFFASPSSIRLFVPTNYEQAPLAAYEFRQVFRLANLFNPTTHIGFAGDLNAYGFAIAYSQYIEYME